MSLWDRLHDPIRRELNLEAPPQLGWRHALGGIAVMLFVLQVLTGILLMVYYQPIASDAYESIQYLMGTAQLGWLVRGLHAWGGSLLVLAMLLHLVRVVLQGAYRGRSFNWAVGVVLLLLVLAFGFTGTLLPWDQSAYWTIDEARAAIEDVPLLGPLLLGLLWGGIEELGEGALLRFYVFHVGLFPWITVGLLLLHVYLVARQGLYEPTSARRAQMNEEGATDGSAHGR